jgi:CheY-like chemotaxis protein
MLGHLGYDVTFARDGAEAIALYSQEKNTDTPFEAVVLDLTVPGGMGGKQTVKKLLTIDPQTKAIVASGYSNDPIIAQFERYGFCDRIVKPYKSEELHAILYRVITTPRASAEPYINTQPINGATRTSSRFADVHDYENVPSSYR